MKRIFTFTLSSLLFLSASAVFAQDQIVVKDDQQVIEMTPLAEQKTEQPAQTDANNTNAPDFNFENNSFYISDEQLEDAKAIDTVEDKANIDTRIIDSSHFSSGTATKTYRPLNKVK